MTNGSFATHSTIVALYSSTTAPKEIKSISNSRMAYPIQTPARPQNDTWQNTANKTADCERDKVLLYFYCLKNYGRKKNDIFFLYSSDFHLGCDPYYSSCIFINPVWSSRLNQQMSERKKNCSADTHKKSTFFPFANVVQGHYGYFNAREFRQQQRNNNNNNHSEANDLHEHAAYRPYCCIEWIHIKLYSWNGWR